MRASWDTTRHRRRYTDAAIFFHWTIAASILVNLITGMTILALSEARIRIRCGALRPYGGWR